MESLRDDIEETRKKKERHAKRNDSLRQELNENELKKESLLRDLDCLTSQELEVIKGKSSNLVAVGPIGCT